ncbi:hypothetical protein [Belliella buryatensis]|uniref:hypothetical protein n=1 Tax=Belliella buryatensis TaxID=1500549 RepID=UPI000B77094E|nr:hypothetical protein [Belliella buryatensis]
MKTVNFIISIWLIFLAFLFRDETFDIQLYDTYYVFKARQVFLVLLVLWIGGARMLIAYNKKYYRKND